MVNSVLIRVGAYKVKKTSHALKLNQLIINKNANPCVQLLKTDLRVFSLGILLIILALSTSSYLIVIFIHLKLCPADAIHNFE